MSDIVHFLIDLTVASALAFFSTTVFAVCVLILKPFLAELWRDFWRERP